MAAEQEPADHQNLEGARLHQDLEPGAYTFVEDSLVKKEAPLRDSAFLDTDMAEGVEFFVDRSGEEVHIQPVPEARNLSKKGKVALATAVTALLGGAGAVDREAEEHYQESVKKELQGKDRLEPLRKTSEGKFTHNGKTVKVTLPKSK